jgi:hypothetical protein
MPDFTSEIEIDVEEFWDECSKREKNELIDLLVNEGFVKLVVDSNINNEFQRPSLMEIEWNTMIDKLSLLRQRVTLEEEQAIKDLVSKYL